MKDTSQSNHQYINAEPMKNSVVFFQTLQGMKLNWIFYHQDSSSNKGLSYPIGSIHEFLPIFLAICQSLLQFSEVNFGIEN